ncbi:MAG TPA: hypothetical protein DD408_04880 [Rheinheimera sp.]|nr:hypothetical protein [Rheinheimera sp.]
MQWALFNILPAALQACNNHCQHQTAL